VFAIRLPANALDAVAAALHHAPRLAGLQAVEPQELRRKRHDRDLAPAAGTWTLLSRMATLVDPDRWNHRVGMIAGVRGAECLAEQPAEQHRQSRDDHRSLRSSQAAHVRGCGPPSIQSTTPRSAKSRDSWASHAARRGPRGGQDYGFTHPLPIMHRS
jgi:hypothetical protein